VIGIGQDRSILGPATGAIARQLLRRSRIRDAAFAALFGVLAYANAAGYRASYPTLGDRLSFAHAFGGNASVRLFYGEPHNLLTVGGYSAWRAGGLLAIFAALWGALTTVRAMRGEEDDGHAEVILAMPMSRRRLHLGALAAIAAGAVCLWLATLVGLLCAGLPLGGSAYLALAIVAAIPPFVGFAAMASQLAGTRRVALELVGGTLALVLLLRTAADTASGADWLRWATPLGWCEEMRAFTGTRPVVLILPLLAGGAFGACALVLALRRDIGSGMLASHERHGARLRLLSSPTALALRAERTSFAAWLVGVGSYALIIGVISRSISKATIPASLEQQVRRLGAVSITKPSGYISLSFLFFVLALSLFSCAQIAAARREEEDERLGVLLALPLDRRRWIAGRVLLALAGACVLAAVAGVFSWLGAAAQGVDVSLPDMLAAGANCVPATLLFLALATFAFALLPRAATPLSYALVALAFVWQLLGGALRAPHWLIELTPFAHVGLVPAQAFKASDAAVMIGVAALAIAASLHIFRGRDLAGA
jgi:ABC-2 type transport system permease protein